MAQRVGQQFGNYQLTRFLGQGGFAEVYLGEHMRMERQAAIKILSASLTGTAVQQFQQEAQTIARLKHPHIIQLYEYDVQQGTPFLAMEYAANDTLRQRHPKGTRLPAETILEYVKQIADALSYAHARYLIHRDIKPENLFLGEHQDILLGDFGIAIVAQSTSQQPIQQIVGTLPYMAPEQLQGHPRPASDQYSLAVVIYEWLSGALPFQGTVQQVMYQQVTTPPPPLHGRVPGITQELEQVVFQALEKDPKDRFPGIQEFAAAFERACLFNLPTSPIVPTPTQPHQYPGQGVSRRVLLTTAAAIIGSTAVGAGVIWLELGKSPSLGQSPTPAPGQILSTYSGHSATIWQVAWSHNSNRIASASGGAQHFPQQDCTVHIWDASSGKTLLVYRKHTNQVYCVAWSPDDSTIASGGDDATVQIWDASTGDLITTFPQENLQYAFKSVAWSVDGKLLASACFDGSTRVWEVATTRELFHSLDYQARVSSAIWSPNGASRITYGGGNEPPEAPGNTTIHLVDLARGDDQVIYTGHNAAVVSMAWSPDGSRIASGGFDKLVHVWDVNTGALRVLCMGHKEVITAVAWSPDGTRLAAAARDNKVLVWNATNGNILYTYNNPLTNKYQTTYIQTVAWSPNSTHLASGGFDQLVQVWQAPHV